MPWIALVAAAVAAAAGKMAEANAQASKHNREGAQHDVNADIAEQNAGIAWQQGVAQEGAVRRRAGQILGQQAAAMGESNFGASGSNIDVARQSAANAELDSLNTLYNTDLRARGFKAQAENERYAGVVEHASAGAARKAGMWGLITGITSSAANYYGSGMNVQPTTQGNTGWGAGYGAGNNYGASGAPGSSGGVMSGTAEGGGWGGG